LLFGKRLLRNVQFSALLWLGDLELELLKLLKLLIQSLKLFIGFRLLDPIHAEKGEDYFSGKQKGRVRAKVHWDNNWLIKLII